MGGAANINYLAIRREDQRQLQTPDGETKIYLGDLLLKHNITILLGAVALEIEIS